MIIFPDNCIFANLLKDPDNFFCCDVASNDHLVQFCVDVIRFNVCKRLYKASSFKLSKRVPKKEEKKVHVFLYWCWEKQEPSIFFMALRIFLIQSSQCKPTFTSTTWPQATKTILVSCNLQTKE